MVVAVEAMDTAGAGEEARAVSRASGFFPSAAGVVAVAAAAVVAAAVAAVAVAAVAAMAVAGAVMAVPATVL